MERYTIVAPAFVSVEVTAADPTQAGQTWLRWRDQHGEIRLSHGAARATSQRRGVAPNDRLPREAGGRSADPANRPACHRVDDPVVYVVSLNLHRRHLTIPELALCAGRASELRTKLEREAAERQKAGKGGGFGPVDPKVITRSRDALGATFGISGNSADRGRNIDQEDATPCPNPKPL